jgi:hypothetical protein
VGRGTTIEFVECYGIADDGFEFFGGTVNTKYLVSAFNDDDAFDADMGYRGHNQFWFGIQEPGTRDKGMEINGEPNEANFGNPPIAAWEAYNVTTIGAGAGSGSGNNAFTVRVYASPSLYNSIFTDFGGRGISIDDTSNTNRINGLLNFQNNLWWGFTGGTNANSATNLAIGSQALPLFNDVTLSNLIVNPLLLGISRTNNYRLDPRPATNSPAWTIARPVPSDGFYTPVSYAGAFGTMNWAADWTTLGKYCIFTGSGAGVPMPVMQAPACVPPDLEIARNGTVVDISFLTVSGRTYQLYSSAAVTGPYAPDGAALPGTGGVVTVSRSAATGNQFFVVGCQ